MGINKLCSLAAQSLINALIFILVESLKYIFIRSCRHKELMSVIYVIFNINAVTGTAEERQRREYIRTGDIRISDEFQ